MVCMLPTQLPTAVPRIRSYKYTEHLMRRHFTRCHLNTPSLPSFKVQHYGIHSQTSFPYTCGCTPLVSTPQKGLGWQKERYAAAFSPNIFSTYYKTHDGFIATGISFHRSASSSTTNQLQVNDEPLDGGYTQWATEQSEAEQTRASFLLEIPHTFADTNKEVSSFDVASILLSTFSINYMILEKSNMLDILDFIAKNGLLRSLSSHPALKYLLYILHEDDFFKAAVVKYCVENELDIFNEFDKFGVEEATLLKTSVLQYKSTAYNRITADLRKIDEKLAPTMAEMQSKNRLIQTVKSILEAKTGGRLFPFGSCENGFWVKNSDVDLCLIAKECQSREAVFAQLKVVRHLLMRNNVGNVLSIAARVPIAKILNNKGESICDVSVNNDAALKNSKLISTFSQIDVRVSPLGRFIKYWAKNRKINDRAAGTLSTYTLLSQLVYFLQTIEPPVLPRFCDIELPLSKEKRKRCSLAGDESPEESGSSSTKTANDNGCEDEAVYKISAAINEDGTIDYPFETRIRYIRENLFEYSKNTLVLGELLFNFFMYFGDTRFSGEENGYTIDMYDSTIIPNSEGVLIVKCPLTGKNINSFTVASWKQIHKEFARARQLLIENASLEELCIGLGMNPLKALTRRRSRGKTLPSQVNSKRKTKPSISKA